MPSYLYKSEFTFEADNDEHAIELVEEETRKLTDRGRLRYSGQFNPKFQLFRVLWERSSSGGVALLGGEPPPTMLAALLRVQAWFRNQPGSRIEDLPSDFIDEAIRQATKS